MLALLSVMALAGNQWQTQGFTSGPLNKGVLYRQMGRVNRTKKNNETPRDWEWQEPVTAWVWWGRGRVNWLRGGHSSEKYERKGLTCCCQNNSDLGMGHVLSTPPPQLPSLFALWSSAGASNRSSVREWRATVTPGESPTWEAPWEGRRMGLS